MNSFDLDDLHRHSGGLAPRRMAVGRLGAIVMGMLTLFGLQTGVAETDRRSGSGRNKKRPLGTEGKKGKRGPAGPPGPPGPGYVVTQVYGETFNVPQGSSNGKLIACPAGSVAIGGGMISANLACILAQSYRSGEQSWNIWVHCPTVAGEGIGFQPHVLCLAPES